MRWRIIVMSSHSMRLSSEQQRSVELLESKSMANRPSVHLEFELNFPRFWIDTCVGLLVVTRDVDFCKNATLII